MRTIIARFRATTARDVLSGARAMVVEMVRLESQHGSKMIAYSKVGRSIGKSGSWVRKIIGRQDVGDIAAHEFVNLTEAYQTIRENYLIECKRQAEALEHEFQQTRPTTMVGRTMVRAAAALGGAQGSAVTAPEESV